MVRDTTLGEEPRGGSPLTTGTRQVWMDERTRVPEASEARVRGVDCVLSRNCFFTSRPCSPNLRHMPQAAGLGVWRAPELGWGQSCPGALL